jgi:hypothetical protein
MNNKKSLQHLVVLTTLLLLLTGCSGALAKASATLSPVAEIASEPRQTATPTANPPTPTPIPPTPTPTPIPEMTLFLCSLDTGQFLAEEWQGAGQFYLYGSDDAKDFRFPLPGDIQGSSYTVSLWLASAGTTTFDVSIVVEQGGGETALAATSFTAKSETYEQFTETITGLDPTTAKGDTLILRISASSAWQGGQLKPGGLAYGGDMASFIKTPPIQ